MAQQEEQAAARLARVRRRVEQWRRTRVAETFVDAARYRGTCYVASNWLKLGQTEGWSRQRVGFVKHGVKKHVFVQPLHRKAVEILKARDLPAELAARRQARQGDGLRQTAPVNGTGGDE